MKRRRLFVMMIKENNKQNTHTHTHTLSIQQIRWVDWTGVQWRTSRDKFFRNVLNIYWFPWLRDDFLLRIDRFHYNCKKTLDKFVVLGSTFLARTSFRRWSEKVERRKIDETLKYSWIFTYSWSINRVSGVFGETFVHVVWCVFKGFEFEWREQQQHDKVQRKMIKRRTRKTTIAVPKTIIDNGGISFDFTLKTIRCFDVKRLGRPKSRTITVKFNRCARKCFRKIRPVKRWTSTGAFESIWYSTAGGNKFSWSFNRRSGSIAWIW